MVVSSIDKKEKKKYSKKKITKKLVQLIKSLIWYDYKLNCAPTRKIK